MTTRRLVEGGLMSVAEAARFLSLSRATLYAWIKDGKLPSARIGHSRRSPRNAVPEIATKSLSHAAPAAVAKQGWRIKRCCRRNG